MKKTLSAVAICVGTMIGAGYASGQEVAAYFGTAPSFLVPVSCGIMMFILIAVLLGVAARTRGSTKEVNRAVFGRASVVADGAMTVNAVIVLSAMMAGADTAMKNITGAELPYGVALCLIGIYVLRRGEKGLAAANTAMVPCIVATLVAVCLYAGQDLTSAPSVKEVPLSAAYVSMNLLLGAGVLVERRGLSRRQILAAGAISAVIIAALLALICGALPLAPASEMPLMSLAETSRPVYALYSACLICSVFTTMIGALSTVQARAKARGSEAMLAAALAGGLLSAIGFEKLVGALYPVIGGIGTAYLVGCAAFLLAPHIKFFRKRDRAVHERGERAERNRGGHDEVGLEHLPAVHDEVAQPRARNEIFAHDRAHPTQTDVDFKYGEKGGDGGGQNGVAQELQAARAHGTEQQQFIRSGGA